MIHGKFIISAELQDRLFERAAVADLVIHVIEEKLLEIPLQVLFQHLLVYRGNPDITTDIYIPGEWQGEGYEFFTLRHERWYSRRALLQQRHENDPKDVSLGYVASPQLASEVLL